MHPRRERDPVGNAARPVGNAAHTPRPPTSVAMHPDAGGLPIVSGGGPAGGVTPAGEGFARNPPAVQYGMIGTPYSALRAAASPYCWAP